MLRINNLNGFGAGGSSLPTYVDSTNSNNSADIVVPSGARDGDIAVLFDAVNNSSAPPPSLVTPSGWTTVVNSTFDNSRYAVSYKKLGSGDPGATITGMTSNNGKIKLMLVFRPGSPVSSISTPTFGTEFTNSNPSSQTVSASGQAAPLIVLGGAGVFGASAPAFTTASPAFDGEVALARSLSGQYSLRMGYTLYGSSPSDHSIDKGDDGSANILWSGYLKLS